MVMFSSEMHASAVFIQTLVYFVKEMLTRDVNYLVIIYCIGGI